MRNDTKQPVGSKGSTKSVRPSILIGVVVLAVLCLVVIVFSLGSGRAPSTAPEQAQQAVIENHAAPVERATRAIQAQAATSEDTLPPKESAGAANVAKANIPPPGPPKPEPTPLARQLMVSLSTFDSSKALTPELADQWKTNFQQLIAQGPAGVAAIREFLEKNTDSVFPADAGKLFGYDSVRKAMFDALQQIGGPEALNAVLNTLQNTADPKEIALLARSLAQLEPEQHEAEILNAVRETLSMAANRNLDGSDMGPLFEVLQKYGGANAIAELEQATGQWKYYATMALAQLPDGAGIPSLTRMVQDPEGFGKGRLDAALQMLAQMSSQYPDARAALMEQVRQDKIPANLWPYLVGPLAGNQFQVLDSAYDSGANLAQGNDSITTKTHVNFNNQNYISAPLANLTPEQINQQLQLLDQLLAATSNPVAAANLQIAKDNLNRRLTQRIGFRNPNS